MTNQLSGVRAGKPRSDGSRVKRFNQLLVLAGLEPLRLLHAARAAGVPAQLPRVPALAARAGVSYVDDAGALHEDVALTPELVAADCDCTLCCAILELVRVR